MCTASLGVPVVPEVWVISVGWSGGAVTGATRGEPARAASSTAPGWLPEASRTVAARSKTSAGSSLASLTASVTRNGSSVRRTSSATVAPSR